MNIKRAIGVGVLTYVVSFIIGLIVMIAMGIDPLQASEIPQSAFIVNIVITIILAGFFTLFYFNDRKIKPNAYEGFMFGVVLVVIGFVFDVVMFFIGSVFAGSKVDIATYYSNPLFWIALFLFIVTTTLVGAFRGKR